MLQVVNLTPFAANIFLAPNEQGIDCAYGVVKATFRISPEVEILDEQAPVVLADEYWGEPGSSSLKSASEYALAKPATDVVLIGSARSPENKAVYHADVVLNVGPIKKVARVFGDRVWEVNRRGTSISAPEPFEAMPLTWERAYGGVDQSNGQHAGESAEGRNPVGVGFRNSKSGKPLDGTKLPNLEDPRSLIRGWRDTPDPIGFGPVCAHWQPRLSYAGTYDEEWQKTRAPYLPQDFDGRFFNVAPSDQVVPGHLKGGESVDIVNVSPSGPLRFQLPALKPRIVYLIDGQEREEAVVLDTVCFETDHNRFTMVWRAVANCDRKSLKVRQINVFCDELPN